MKVEVKCGVIKIVRLEAQGNYTTLGSLSYPAVWGIQREADFINVKYKIIEKYTYIPYSLVSR